MIVYAHRWRLVRSTSSNDGQNSEALITEACPCGLTRRTNFSTQTPTETVHQAPDGREWYTDPPCQGYNDSTPLPQQPEGCPMTKEGTVMGHEFVTIVRCPRTGSQVMV